MNFSQFAFMSDNVWSFRSSITEVVAHQLLQQPVVSLKGPPHGCRCNIAKGSSPTTNVSPRWGS